MDTQLVDWFGGSVAIDEFGRPQAFYHGSVADFQSFDVNKIRANETDAVYNGFWFTSEKESASPAWRDPRFIKSCYLRICNPAPHDVVQTVYSEIRDNLQKYESEYPHNRSYADLVRFVLESRGYDGVIHDDRPIVNLEEFTLTGETSFFTKRGRMYTIRVDEEFGGVDLFRGTDDHLTGYENYDDFISQHSERIFVAFNPDQILVTETEKAM